MNKKTALLISTLIAALAAGSALAQGQPAAAQPKKPASQDPLAAMMKSKPVDDDAVTVITSDRLFYDYKQKFALFQTNVVVVDPRIKITADQMSVFFDETNRVQAIRCEGRVRISQEDKTARSDLATYDIRSGEIILTGGKPEVVSGRNVMTGDPIIFNRDSNTVNVPGTTERPRLIIAPGQGGGATDLLKLDEKPKNGAAEKEKPRGK